MIRLCILFSGYMGVLLLQSLTTKPLFQSNPFVTAGSVLIILFHYCMLCCLNFQPSKPSCPCTTSTSFAYVSARAAIASHVIFRMSKWFCVQLILLNRSSLLTLYYAQLFSHDLLSLSLLASSCRAYFNAICMIKASHTNRSYSHIIFVRRVDLPLYKIPLLLSFLISFVYFS